MNSIESLMGMVLTETVEESDSRSFGSSDSQLLSIRYDLELLEDSNGSLYWVE